jgi:hypothetical protein
MKNAAALLTLLLLSLFPKTPMPSQKTLQAKDDRLRTRAELTNYEETSRYEDVVSFVGELQTRTPLLRVESFGRSEEGRDLPLLIFSNPPAAAPRETRAGGKPVVFVMANIHAGEVEGKEAMLGLARRLALGDLRPLLDRLVILVAPIYNADGNERISPDNRGEQHGPVGGVGTRENARGLDLNRDYMKLESAEARALVGLFNRWDPHLTVDLHTTNGSYHGYHLTYAPTLNPNADARLVAFERSKLLPAVTRAMLRRHKFRTYFYGNFATKESPNYEVERFAAKHEGKEKIWRTFDHRPRFGNNYAGLRNRLTVLSEAYSYLDFRRRVAVTEAFVEEILKYSAAHADEIAALVKRVDEDAVRRGLGAATRAPSELGVEFEIKPLPRPVEILVGAVEKKKNPRSGRQMTAMLEGQFTPALMPDYGLFEVKRRVAVPRAYVFRNEPGLQVVVEKLQAHGVAVEELTAPLSAEVESFTLTSVSRAAREFQGHRAVSLKGRAKAEAVTFPAGSYLVRMAQPLSTLAFYLLEAESDDGLAAWNFLDAYLEKGGAYPIYKVTAEVKAASRLLR